MGKKGAWEILWREEKKTLTLDGETVLEYCLRWPRVEGSGRGAGRLSRGYEAMADRWRRRWKRKVYCQACLQLAACRAQARPFTPWRCALEGEVTLEEENRLGLKLQAWEERGDGRPCRVCWGDAWKVREGAPLLLREVLPRKRGWKKALCRQLTEQGEQLQRTGGCFLNPGWQSRVRALLPGEDYCLYSDRVEFPFPQCTLAPAVEGTPILWVSRPEKAEPEH